MCTLPDDAGAPRPMALCTRARDVGAHASVVDGEYMPWCSFKHRHACSMCLAMAAVMLISSESSTADGHGSDDGSGDDRGGNGTPGSGVKVVGAKSLTPGAVSPTTLPRA